MGFADGYCDGIGTNLWAIERAAGEGQFDAAHTASAPLAKDIEHLRVYLA